MKQTVLIIGSSGLLGSAISVDLAKDYNVIGLYRRKPPEIQIKAAPDAHWEKGDIVDEDCIDSIFKKYASLGRPIEYVIHFAAFTDYGEKWQDEYFDTNVIGTRNIIEVAAGNPEVKRILFAGSIAALDPPSPGEKLTEKTPAGGCIAYSRSKAMGEALLLENSHRVPSVTLRIGGVFTDWCELPPLYSVIKTWSKPLFGCFIPGFGISGFPYIHRRDLVGIVRRIIEKNDSIPPFDTFFASHSGCTCQKEIFPVVRGGCGRRYSTKPIHISPSVAASYLHAQYVINTLRNRPTYERPWMIKYVDRPLIVDTSYTREKLDWKPDPNLHIINRLPVLMDRFNRERKKWFARNIRRNDQKYIYEPD